MARARFWPGHSQAGLRTDAALRRHMDATIPKGRFPLCGRDV